MYIVGLTGGIASGKSTVSNMLSQLGAYIVDTDKIARAIVMPNEPAWHDIVAHFGNEILLPDGNIDREYLGEKVFKDTRQRQNLEKITHPHIKNQVNISIAQAQQLGYKVAVLDVPLLFEVGWQNMVDEIWVIYVDSKAQVSRLITRNTLTHEQAVARINSQMSLDEKRKLADIVIDNTLDMEHTKQQVLTAWDNLQQRLTLMRTV